MTTESNSNELQKNVQLMVKGEVMGTPIEGGYASKGDLSSKDDFEKVILYGKADKNPGMTIAEAIKSFEKLGIGIKLEDIANKIPSKIMSVADTTKITLLDAYYYKAKVVNSGNDNPEEEVQYALWIEVDMGGVIPDDFIMDLNSVSLKLWSSNTPVKILEEMKIIKMQSLLNASTGNAA